jgi:excisionase family DNA binding protein
MKSVKIDLIEGAAAAAAVLGLSKRQVYHMVANKRLPCTRIGNRLYFRRSELERAFSANDNDFSPLSATALTEMIKRGYAQCLKM